MPTHTRLSVYAKNEVLHIKCEITLSTIYIKLQHFTEFLYTDPTNIYLKKTLPSMINIVHMYLYDIF
jgi:hypothetical protein